MHPIKTSRENRQRVKGTPAHGTQGTYMAFKATSQIILPSSRHPIKTIRENIQCVKLNTSLWYTPRTIDVEAFIKLLPR